MKIVLKCCKYRKVFDQGFYSNILNSDLLVIKFIVLTSFCYFLKALPSRSIEEMHQLHSCLSKLVKLMFRLAVLNCSQLLRLNCS